MKKLIKPIALLLVIVGALNWGLVGLFDFDLVAEILGAGSMASNVVYVIVGLAAVVLIAFEVPKIMKKK